MKNSVLKIKKYMKNNILLIFISFVVFMSALGIIYYVGLIPKDDEILKIVEKFTANNYSIPYRIAERYLTWFNMRTFFFALDYILTLLALIAGLMTAFYASTDKDGAQNEIKRKKYIIFLSLLSMFFTVANIFVNAGSMANMAQHAWRGLDSCIMETINRTDLSSNEKDKIITDKLIEMESYIESYEH